VRAQVAPCKRLREAHGGANVPRLAHGAGAQLQYGPTPIEDDAVPATAARVEESVSKPRVEAASYMPGHGASSSAAVRTDLAQPLRERPPGRSASGLDGARKTRADVAQRRSGMEMHV